MHNHDCTQDKKISQLSCKLDKHIEDQKEHEKSLDDKLDGIIVQMKELLELNSEVGNIKIAWKVGKNIGLGLMAFIMFMSIVSGAIYALKEWIKR